MTNKMGDIVNNQGIVTQNQTGNNTINQAPKPELKQVSAEQKINPDGSQTVIAVVQIIAPYPPGELFLSATADGITGFDVGPQRTGIMQTGHSGQRGNMRFTTIYSPYGAYAIRIQTAAAAKVMIDYDFK